MLQLFSQILADAMGLGKTVMTIALILARINGERPCNNGYSHENGSNTKGGTLIVCPMALLGQWKVRIYIIIS